MTNSNAIHSTITKPVKPTTLLGVESKAASKDKGWIYVYDDEGTFDSALVADFESDQEAAISMIEAVMDWTDEDAAGSDEDIQAHLSELDVKGHAVDVTELDWFETLLGFTFSVKKHTLITTNKEER